MGLQHAAEFRLLGPVEVDLRGEAQTLGGPRQRAVLAALLLHSNQEVRTGQLMELVWSDMPSSAESNLRTYLTRLRRILTVPDEPKSRLCTLRGRQVLTVRLGELDLATFLEQVALGEQAGDVSDACRHLQRALNMWHGHALENVARGPLLEAEAVRLEALRDRAYESLLRARAMLGQHADLIPELRALLLHNPLQEGMVSMLMLALYRTGRRIEALDVFRQTRKRLVDELGVEPGPELQQLHRQLLAGETVNLVPA